MPSVLTWINKLKILDFDHLITSFSLKTELHGLTVKSQAVIIYRGLPTLYDIGNVELLVAGVTSVQQVQQ